VVPVSGGIGELNRGLHLGLEREPPAAAQRSR